MFIFAILFIYYFIKKSCFVSQVRKYLKIDIDMHSDNSLKARIGSENATSAETGNWLNFIHFLGYKYKIRLVSILRQREDQVQYPPF